MALNFSESDYKTFLGIPAARKAEIMTLYLIGDNNGNTYTMPELGERFYGKEIYSQTVSCIHRGYGFSRKNEGKYCKNCDFEREYGYEVSRADIEAYIRKYPKGSIGKNPNGSYDSSKPFESFEEFLISRANTVKKQHTPKQQVNFQQAWTQQTQQMPQSNRSASNSDTWTVIGIVILIMVIMFVFNAFDIRTKLILGIMNIIAFLMLAGIALLLILTLINKVPNMSRDLTLGKRFLRFIGLSAGLYLIGYIILRILAAIGGINV